MKNFYSMKNQELIKSEELEKTSNRSKMGLDYEVEQIIFHFLNEMFVCVCTYVLSP